MTKCVLCGWEWKGSEDELPCLVTSEARNWFDEQRGMHVVTKPVEGMRQCVRFWAQAIQHGIPEEAIRAVPELEGFDAEEEARIAYYRAFSAVMVG